MSFERNHKLGSPNSSVISIRIGYPKKRKINIFGIYRQHKLLNQNKINPNDKKTEEFPNQCELIKELLINNEETIVINNINVIKQQR